MADKQMITSTKGWNWGNYALGQDQMSFTVNGQRVFAINYKEIALSNAANKNEVVLEFQQVGGEDGMTKKK
jgi:hypothetical protein